MKCRSHAGLQTSHKAIRWYRRKNKHPDQWNKIESPERDPHIYSQLVSDNDLKKRGNTMRKEKEKGCCNKVICEGEVQPIPTTG